MPNNGLYRDGTQGKRPHYTHNRGNKTSVSTIDDVKKCKGCLNGGWNGMTFPDPPPVLPPQISCWAISCFFTASKLPAGQWYETIGSQRDMQCIHAVPSFRETVLYEKIGMYSHVRYFPLFID
jgi:hypothetical protein